MMINKALILSGSVLITLTLAGCVGSAGYDDEYSDYGPTGAINPAAGAPNLNEQIFQQHCVWTTPDDAGEIRACQALAQSIGRSYTSPAVARGGMPGSSGHCRPQEIKCHPDDAQCRALPLCNPPY